MAADSRVAESLVVVEYLVVAGNLVVVDKMEERTQVIVAASPVEFDRPVSRYTD